MRRYLTSITVILLMFAAFLLPPAAHAQLQEVQQTVFGMDCAPCAYGLEKRMKAFEGIQDADVSLNKGLATLKLQPENKVTLEKIRTAVRESGFSPEDATITVTGTLTQEDGQWILASAAGERYRLTQTAKNGSEHMKAHEQVTVTGRVAEGEKNPQMPWPLQVTEVKT